MERLDFSDFFHTKTESNEFLVRLSNISDQVFETNFNLEKALDKQFGLEKKDRFLVFLREENVSLDSPKSLKDFLDKLQLNISNLPTLYINIAFEPTQETLELLSQWFMLNSDKQYVFDITVVPDLMAGAVLNLNGKYFDYSVKEKFNKIVKEVIQAEENLLPQKPAQNNTHLSN
jgi:ATP synthase delta (OSCP) subunit